MPVPKKQTWMERSYDPISKMPPSIVHKLYLNVAKLKLLHYDACKLKSNHKHLHVFPSIRLYSPIEIQRILFMKWLNCTRYFLRWFWAWIYRGFKMERKWFSCTLECYENPEGVTISHKLPSVTVAMTPHQRVWVLWCREEEYLNCTRWDCTLTSMSPVGKVGWSSNPFGPINKHMKCAYMWGVVVVLSHRSTQLGSAFILPYLKTFIHTL